MLTLVEIKELAPDEIAEQLKKSRQELVELRMKFASRQLEDPSQIGKKRKEIARLLTLETQKLTGKESVTKKISEKVVKSEAKKKEVTGRKKKVEKKEK